MEFFVSLVPLTIPSWVIICREKFFVFPRVHFLENHPKTCKQCCVKEYKYFQCCVRVYSLSIENTFQIEKNHFTFVTRDWVSESIPSDRSKLLSSARLSILTRFYPLIVIPSPLRSKSNFQNLNSHIKIQTFKELVRSLNLNFKFPIQKVSDAFLKENKPGLKFSTVYSYNKIFSDLVILTNKFY